MAAVGAKALNADVPLLGFYTGVIDDAPAAATMPAPHSGQDGVLRCGGNLPPELVGWGSEVMANWRGHIR